MQQLFFICACKAKNQLLPVGDVRTDGICHIVNGHGLQPYTVRAGQNGVKEPFAAKKHILGTGHRLDVHLVSPS